MSGNLLHLGQDLSQRVPVLRQAGYTVKECRSLRQLRSSLEDRLLADAVVLTEGVLADPGLSATRAQSSLPFILFEDHASSAAGFDLVIPASVPPAQWLLDIEILVSRSLRIRAESREIRARSALLIDQASEVVARTQRELTRAREECACDVNRMKGDWGTPRPSALDHTPGAALCAERIELDKAILLALARLNLTLHRMLREGLIGAAPSPALDSLKVEHQAECALLESLLSQWTAHRKLHGC